MKDGSHDVALVIGAGAFGTSIASVLSHNFKRVIVKVRSEDIYQELQKGINSLYLPDQTLNRNIVPALSWDEVKELAPKIDLLVSGIPTSPLRSYLEENYDQLESYLASGIPLVSLSKGIDAETLELPDDLFLHHFASFRDQLTFLSGPSFAKEIVNQQITLVSLAGRSKQVLEQVSVMMKTPYFKTFASYDIKGALLGGALKNILAIGGGIIEGLGFNHNTRAAMITRGITEMLRFGHVFNARPETFYGLSGMGDLILTTTGGLSRNKQFGMEIAKGRSADEIISSSRSVVEGYKTTLAAHRLIKRYDINARIFNGVYSVLYKGLTPQEVITELMMTPPKFEVD
jgi:glycerol-3-phosphate dehydrogenase (NAD(P)+)